MREKSCRATSKFSQLKGWRATASTCESAHSGYLPAKQTVCGTSWGGAYCPRQGLMMIWRFSSCTGYLALPSSLCRVRIYKYAWFKEALFCFCFPNVCQSVSSMAHQTGKYTIVSLMCDVFRHYHLPIYIWSWFPMRSVKSLVVKVQLVKINSLNFSLKNIFYWSHNLFWSHIFCDALPV